MWRLLLVVAVVCALASACSSENSASQGVPAGRRLPAQTGGGMFGGPQGGPEEPVSVKATRVVRQPISEFLLSNTTLESIREVTIYAKVNAIVEELFVEEGSRVEKGQLLVRLDDREIRNEYDQAKIALGQANLSLEQARVKLRLSKIEYDRSQDLLAQKLISQQEYEQSSLTHDTDELALKVAEEQKEAARARLEAAQLQLDYTQITSTISGVITERLIDVGDRVNTNEALFSIEDFNPLWARIYLPEREIPKIRVGQRAELRMQAYGKETFTGSIKMISPTVDPESGTLKVTLEVSSPRHLLRPGMFGTVYIATATRPSALVIQKRAIVRERDENRVFVIGENNQVEKRDVTIGFSQEDKVEILSGLSEGEAVVTVGQEGLNDGYPVSVLAWEGRPGEEREEATRAAAASGANLAGDVPQTRPAARGTGAGNGPRGPGQGTPDPARLKAFLDRMMERNPQVKEAYEAKIAEDPDFANDPQKLGAFMREIRSEFSRGRQ